MNWQSNEYSHLQQSMATEISSNVRKRRYFPDGSEIAFWPDVIYQRQYGGG
jgi:hypothetical protein